MIILYVFLVKKIENMLMHAVKDDYFICFLGKENMLMHAVKD